MTPTQTVVIDIKGKASDSRIKHMIRNHPQAHFVAFTPSAAWGLEKAGTPFQRLEQIFTPEEFREQGIRNFDRTVSLLKAVGGKDWESYGGLYYSLKLFFDYLIQETAKFELVSAHKAIVYSDSTRAAPSSTSINSHIFNKHSLYHLGAQDGRVRYFAKTVPLRTRLRNLLESAGIKHPKSYLRDRLKKLLRVRFPNTTPADKAILTSFHYDWSVYREALSQEYAQVQISALFGSIPTVGTISGVEEKIATAVAEFEQLFKFIPPQILEEASRLLAKEIRAYDTLRARVRSGLPSAVSKLRIRAALSTFCASHEDFLIHYYLKQLGIPTILYQHGAYFGEASCLEFGEILPATHNLVFGEGDKEFFAKSRFKSNTLAVGSALLDSLGPSRPSNPKRFLYVLDVASGNAANVTSTTDLPVIDGITLFDRHRKVIDLFRKYPDVELVLKPHPAQYDWCLYSPLQEYVQLEQCGNIKIADARQSAEQLLGSSGCLILDYTCTTLVQGLAKNHPHIICFIGRPFIPPKATAEKLKEAIPATESEEELLLIIENSIKDPNSSRVRSEAKVKEFQTLFGNHRTPQGGSSYDRVLGFVREITKP